jgi:hypothetical protein
MALQRAAAVRELLRRGLAAEGFDSASRATKSKDFSVVEKLGDKNADTKNRPTRKRT